MKPPRAVSREMATRMMMAGVDVFTACMPIIHVAMNGRKPEIAPARLYPRLVALDP